MTVCPCWMSVGVSPNLSKVTTFGTPYTRTFDEEEEEYVCEYQTEQDPGYGGRLVRDVDDACALGQPQLFPPSAQFQLACIKSPFPNVNLALSFGNLLVSCGDLLARLLEALSALQQLVR
jgi:hypothetical protein